tara:strand:- start:329 stop:580 length:252 start_codon:yes stop_codon:yes gene_type:complete
MIEKLQKEGRHDDAKNLAYTFKNYRARNQIRQARKEGIGSSPTAFLIITCRKCQNKFNLKPVNFEGYVACPKCNFSNFVESLY